MTASCSLLIKRLPFVFGVSIKLYYHLWMPLISADVNASRMQVYWFWAVERLSHSGL